MLAVYIQVFDMLTLLDTKVSVMRIADSLSDLFYYFCSNLLDSHAHKIHMAPTSS